MSQRSRAVGFGSSDHFTTSSHGADFDELGVSDVTDLLTSPETHMEVVLAEFNNKRETRRILQGL
jgi:hypothetical protein